MTKHEKFLKRLMSGQADTTISFGDMCLLLQRLGLGLRVRGDHHIFTGEDIVEIINLQPNGSLAKPYQVKQVRNLLRKYCLNEE